MKAKSELISILFCLPLPLHISLNKCHGPDTLILLRGNLKKKSLFKDIIQIKDDHPPSYPIFDKF